MQLEKSVKNIRQYMYIYIYANEIVYIYANMYFHYQFVQHVNYVFALDFIRINYERMFYDNLY